MSDLEDNGLSTSAMNPTRAEIAETTVSNQSSPVVFQCSVCNSVVGDSTFWISANEKMRSITLTNVTSKVGVRPDVDISKNGVDKDCTFRELYCVNCGEELGKQYLASPPDLDCIRGGFTFMVEKLNSYEVGSAEMGGHTDMADMLTVPSARYMQQQLKKIHYLIMSMSGRIQALETASNDKAAPAVSPKTNGSAQQTSSENNVDESESVTSSENVTEMNQIHQMYRARDRSMSQNTRQTSHTEGYEVNGSKDSENASGDYEENANRPRGRGKASARGSDGTWQAVENCRRDRQTPVNRGSRNVEGSNTGRSNRGNQRDGNDRSGNVKRANQETGKTFPLNEKVGDKVVLMSPKQGSASHQYTKESTKSGRGQSRYVQKVVTDALTDDMTDESVYELGGDDGQMSGVSLMEQWPSPRTQKMRSTRKRKLVDDN